MKNILVIPDSHSHPDFNNDRFSWLGKFILDRKPDVVLDVGDSADMASLCQYDRGTTRAEGRRYTEDLRAYHDAQNKLWEPILEYNEMRRRNKQKIYSPHKVKCIGNHEQRIVRAGVEDPKLHGHLSLEDLGDHHYYDEVYPFLQPYICEGIAFQHYFTSGVMGNAIGGIHAAATMVRRNLMSCVAGHSHLRDYHEALKADGTRVFGLTVGCYVDYEPDWTSEHPRWWRGIVMLNNAHDGTCDPEFISINIMKELYS